MFLALKTTSVAFINLVITEASGEAVCIAFVVNSWMSDVPKMANVLKSTVVQCSEAVNRIPVISVH